MLDSLLDMVVKWRDTILGSNGDDSQASGVDSSLDDGTGACSWTEVLLQAINAPPEISGYPCN